MILKAISANNVAKIRLHEEKQTNEFRYIERYLHNWRQRTFLGKSKEKIKVWEAYPGSRIYTVEEIEKSGRFRVENNIVYRKCFCEIYLKRGSSEATYYDTNEEGHREFRKLQKKYNVLEI